MRSRARFAVPLAMIGVACSLTNLDGFSEKRGGDGGDGTAPDGAGHDAGSDGPSDGSASGFCARQDASYRICTDFDPPQGSVTAAFERGLVPVPGGAGGTFDFDSRLFVSPTRGARGVANPFGPGATSGVRLTARLWPFGPTPASVHCELAWNPQQLSTTANDYAHVVQIAVFDSPDDNSQVASLSFNMQADGKLVFHEDHPGGANNRDTLIPRPIGADTWIPLGITFTPGSAVLVVGDVSAAAPFSVSLPESSFATLSIGPAYYAGATTSASPGWTFVYDDLVCW